MSRGRHDVRSTKDIGGVKEAEWHLVRVVGIGKLEARKSAVHETAGVGLIALEPANPYKVDTLPLRRSTSRSGASVPNICMEDTNDAGVPKGMVVVGVLVCKHHDVRMSLRVDVVLVAPHVVGSVVELQGLVRI